MAEIEFNNKEEVVNTDLEKVVVEDSPVKEWLVNYVGEKINPEDGNVTVGMVVETLAEEFPEFLLVIAEENFIRGYEQALTDVEVGQSMAEAEAMINND
tara:strand:+ start:2131 stop:2427 length:297 start_codon:yes stop_codon:yes gene_type:complete